MNRSCNIMNDEYYCEGCQWFEKCGDVDIEICEDYSPIGDAEDDYIDEYIERKRNEFRDEWTEYIIGFYDNDKDYFYDDWIGGISNKY